MIIKRHIQEVNEMKVDEDKINCDVNKHLERIFDKYIEINFLNF